MPEVRVQLEDLFNLKVGDVALARGLDWDVQEQYETIRSQSRGLHLFDKGPCSISGRMSCEDPLAVSAITALTFPLTVEGAGRIVNTATYGKDQLLHALLRTLDLSIRDGQLGTMALGFQNVAASASATASDEHPGVAAVAPVHVDRRGTVKVLGSLSSFTPWGSQTAVTIPGLVGADLRLVLEMYIGRSPEARCTDEVCGHEWGGDGSIDLDDRELVSAAHMATALAKLGSGTLVAGLRPTGYWAEPTTPAAWLLTIDGVTFTGSSGPMKTKVKAANQLQFVLNTTKPGQGSASQLGLAALVTAAVVQA